tara:strand:- start:1601 stop:3931 length:2331 start_codon:yes stop_codon:yes gene_type:complete
MSAIFKILLNFIIFLSIFNFNPAISKEYKNCNNFDSLNYDNSTNYIPIEEINIKIDEYKKWQVNNIRILTNNSHLIPDKFKKKFNSTIIVKYQNKLFCEIKARVRTHGDLKDHIIYKDGKVFQSLDVDLKEGHINNITKFKLFLSKTRGVDEDEIFMTELLREFSFISPRTQLVKVNLNGIKNKMIFQEKSTKELLEFHKRREGPILEGDEKYMMKFSSKVKNHGRVNWSEILRVSELGTKIQLAKVTNSKWAVKNEIFKKNAFLALDKLNFAYLVYLNSFQDENNKYSFLDYNLDNKILSQGIKRNLHKLNVFNNLILAANGNHALYVHNRKFYWNSEENYFEPIYYDGEFNIKKSQKNLNFPLSENYKDSLKELRLLILRLDIIKLQKNLKSKNLLYTENKIQSKLKNILLNIDELEKLFDQKDKDQIKYNNESYQNKKLKKRFLDNFKKQNIEAKFIQYEVDKDVFKICNKDLSKCEDIININLKDQRKLLESELRLKKNNIEYLKLVNDYPYKYQKINLNDENFNGVTFYFNEGIVYNYDVKNRIFEINQKDLSGRSFFLEGQINDIQIVYKGEFEYFNDRLEKRIDLNNLTGCLSFIKINFVNPSISSTNSTCEDGINIINSLGKLNEVTSNNSLYDAIDIDFSKLYIKNVKVNNALNDCLDFSFGDYEVSDSYLELCGDKAISVGEKSIANFDFIDLQKAKIGLASKDSSRVYVENSKISKVENCFASYRKKQEFDGGFIKIKVSNCKTFSKNLFFDKDSKIEIIKNENI